MVYIIGISQINSINVLVRAALHCGGKSIVELGMQNENDLHS